MPPAAPDLLAAVLTLRATGLPPWALGDTTISRSRLREAASLLAPAFVLAPQYLAVTVAKRGGSCPLLSE